MTSKISALNIKRCSANKWKRENPSPAPQLSFANKLKRLMICVDRRSRAYALVRRESPSEMIPRGSKALRAMLEE